MKVKTNHRNLVRDMTNGAILNTDLAGAQEYKKMRNKFLNRDKEINDLKTQINQLTLLVQKLVDKE